jgi:GGDEF domain-containing protein
MLAQADSLEGAKRSTIINSCRNIVRAELNRQKKSSETIQLVLGKVQEGSRPHIDPAQAVDPITGLATRLQAEQALLKGHASRRCSQVAVYVLERLHLIQNRIGPAAANMAVLCFGQNLAQRMRGTEKLFRWGTASFLAIFPESRPDLADTVPPKVEHTVDVGSRTVTFRVRCQWTKFPVQIAEPVEALVNRIDTFVNRLGAC